MLSSLPVTQLLRHFSRVLCVMMAGVWFLGTVTGLLHAALVQHVTCAVHGELIHAEAGDTHSQRLTVTQTARTLGQADSDHPDDLDAHEHCAVMQAARARAVTPSGTQVSYTYIAPVTGAHILDQPVQIAPLPILRSAPKTSPPSA